MSRPHHSDELAMRWPRPPPWLSVPNAVGMPWHLAAHCQWQAVCQCQAASEAGMLQCRARSCSRSALTLDMLHYNQEASPDASVWLWEPQELPRGPQRVFGQPPSRYQPAVPLGSHPPDASSLCFWGSRPHPPDVLPSCP
jgi:hypothetical protein